MPSLLNRISISRKIVGLVAILLGIMLGIAVLNDFQAIQERDEVTDLTENLVPITGALSNIGIHLLEQEVHFERALRLIQGGFRQDQHVDREIRKFETLGRIVDSEVEQATQSIGRKLETSRLIEDAIALARLEPVLTQFGKQHQQYHDLAIKLIETVKSGDGATARSMEEELEREKDHMRAEITALVDRMRSFVEKQAHLITVHEEQGRQAALQNLIITALAFVLGVIIAIIIARRIILPMRQLTESAEAVARGELDIEVRSTMSDEVGVLATAFKQMIVGLKEKESIREAFGTYVDPRIVRHLVAPGTKDYKGDRREMTVLFSDIADFTGISEQLTPQALFELINAYFSSMSRAIAIEDGVIDKFVGDTLMAYWGPPFVGENEHALRAVRAGLDMFALLERFQRDIPEITGLRTGAPVIDIRIGIATGPVLIGSLGSDTVKNYTIMGDTVNVAARLESACKYYGNRFLISESTRDLVGNAIVAREIDLVAVKGKREPTRVFEPIGMAGNVDPDTERLLGVYQAGLRAYRQQEWAQAEDSFRTYLAKLDHDGPSKIYLDRIAVLKEKPPGPDWGGVWRMLSK